MLYLRILDPFKVCWQQLEQIQISSFLFFLNSLYTFVCSQASYGVEDPEYAVTQLAQTTMRSELGKLTLDKVFRVKTNCCFISYLFCSWRDKLYFIFAFVFKERESLNSNIVHSINQASDEWGIRCLRYEIKDIHVPPRVKESMQMQVRETKELFGAQFLVFNSLHDLMVQMGITWKYSLAIQVQFISSTESIDFL